MGRSSHGDGLGGALAWYSEGHFGFDLLECRSMVLSLVATHPTRAGLTIVSESDGMLSGRNPPWHELHGPGDHSFTMVPTFCSSRWSAHADTYNGLVPLGGIEPPPLGLKSLGSPRTEEMALIIFAPHSVPIMIAAKQVE